MSHVAEIDLKIYDIEALKAACKEMGLELVKASTYKWFGRHVGDYPIPAGFKKEDLGKCDYAIRIPRNGTAYEIGVVKNKNGKKGFTLLYDFWAGGYGLVEKVGKDAVKLKDHYGAQVAKKQLRKQGFKVKQKIAQDGKIILKAS